MPETGYKGTSKKGVPDTKPNKVICLNSSRVDTEGDKTNSHKNSTQVHITKWQEEKQKTALTYFWAPYYQMHKLFVFSY